MTMSETPIAGDVDYALHGRTYTQQRRADPRIERLIHDALGDAEPADRQVTAVEPSAAMRAKRGPERVPAIDATAENLPFDDRSFDAAMATITVHQWQDLGRGLAEMRRVTRGPIVLLAFDPAAVADFWLIDYVPEMAAVQERRDPAIATITTLLGGESVVGTVPVPIDCVDGFTEAFYARPDAFLNPAVRGAQSTWNFVSAEATARCVSTLARDLADGSWERRYGHWRRMPHFAGSLRLIVNRPG